MRRTREFKTLETQAHNENVTSIICPVILNFIDLIEKITFSRKNNNKKQENKIKIEKYKKGND